MMSISNSERRVEDRILDAAAACVLAYGPERITLAEIARRAQVSRPTIYRRWPDIRGVLAELLTLRISAVLDAVDDNGVGRAATVARVVAVARHLRDDEVVMSVLRDARGFAMTYIADRLGTSQHIVVDTLAEAIKAGQDEGSIRAGDPRAMAAMCLLITQSTIQSVQTVADLLGPASLDIELSYALNGYLHP